MCKNCIRCNTALPPSEWYSTFALTIMPTLGTVNAQLQCNETVYNECVKNPFVVKTAQNLFEFVTI